MKKTLIERIEVGAGGAASITFSAIAGDYTDLLLVLSLRDSQAAVNSYATISFNGSTASFSMRGLGGSGSSASSYTSPGDFAGEIAAANATSNTFGSSQIYIPNYRSSAAKSYSIDAVGENNGTAAFQSLVAGLWNVTDAITSITITPLSAPLAQYSSASLYGITRGSDGTTTVS